jgi:tRNA-specific 2-thiouridylase
MSEVKRVLVAMSGGVDSSVAAALLREAGHDLVGVTLHLWDAEGEHQVGRCCAPEDRDDARRTCEHLGIPHYVLDEREAFRKNVVDPFITEYQAGRTPIPCVSCNRTVKLTYLADVARRFDATHIATGHYARLERADDGQLRLLRGRDDDKDQSYFLFGLPQSTLETLVFPLGNLTKSEVRAAGRRLRVPNADKPESQELCFVPDGGVGEFINRQGSPTTFGNIVDPAVRSSWATSPSSMISSSRRPMHTGLRAAPQMRSRARFASDIGIVARSRTSPRRVTDSRCASTSLSVRLRLARPQWYTVVKR